MNRTTNMVPYTTNCTNRTRTTGLLAVVATALVIGLAPPINAAFGIVTGDRLWLAAILAPPTPIALFGLFHLAYDNWAWRKPIMGSRIPDLNGHWTGQVTFENTTDEPLDCEVDIQQTWSRISVAFYGLHDGKRQTRSSIIMAALNRMELLGGLRYEYLVSPYSGVANHVVAVGTAHLAFAGEDMNRLIGEYHNLPQKIGNDWVQRHGGYSIHKVRRRQP